MVRRGQVKCDKCHGKGMSVSHENRFGVKVYHDCLQCLGRGNWWPNKKPQQSKVKRR